MKKGNFVTAGIFALFAVFIIINSLTFPASRDGIPGPGFFPIVIAVLMLLAAVSLTVTSLRMKDGEDMVLKLFTDDNKRVYICMGLLVLYLAVMSQVGFCVSSFALLLGLIRWFGRYKLLFCAIFSAAVVVPLYLVFSFVLHVPLNFGLLF